MTRLLLLPLLLATAVAAPSGDAVRGEDLPGWNAKLPSPIHSGFLDIVGSAKRLHYVLVDAEVPDPSSAPVVLWLNGGPGCSSLEGFFYEHGPLVVSDAHAPPNINFNGKPSSNDPPKKQNEAGSSTGTTLVRNDWSWSKHANILYLEAPAGVGFSYSPVAKDLTTGDNQTATDSLVALDAFFTQKVRLRCGPRSHPTHAARLS